ncbi:MAG: cell division protein FtsL [Deltaproteobacteria bacterium]|nr:cell division protein FtsL [Deltaproteobacteria bacterium]MBW2136580.1 cell division protein FtsL [Deltaproteobacteria bacterium]
MVRPIQRAESEGRRNARTGVRVSNARKKKVTFRLTHRQILLMALILVVFMGSGIGYVWSNFEGTQIGYDLSRLKEEELRLREVNKKLRVELATLKSPQSLERYIRRLGLREPSPEQIIILP